MTKKRKFSEGLFNTELLIDNLAICPGQVVLDAGCGNGYMAKKFSKVVGDAGKVYALDCDSHLINTLKAEVEGTNIEALTGDISKTTTLKDCSMDLVYLATVFHIFSGSQVIWFDQEINRILRPKGTLAIVNIVKEETPFGPPVSMRSSPEELRAKLSLIPEKLVVVNEYFYMQLFKRK
jgi:ubiquinone/menaquinone biosynthesis C-methylase UbiE